jgi:lysozyme
MATKELEEMLIRHEALKLMPYRCSAGKLTIGVGRNLEDRGITDAEARMMLSYDVASAEADALKFGWFKELEQPRKDAILNMIFNLGLARFREFKKFIKLMEEKRYPEASKEMLSSKWADQVGDRAKELSFIIESGKYRKKVLP